VEPEEKLDLYRSMKRFADAIGPELARLTSIMDGAVLAVRIDRLVRDKRPSFQAWETRLRILRTALQLAGRLDKSFTVGLLDLALQALDQSSGELNSPETFASAISVVQNGLVAAAHHGCPEQAQRLTERLGQLMQKPESLRAFSMAEFGVVLRALFKLGLREEVDRLITQFSETILQTEPVTALLQSSAADWSGRHLGLTYMAGGWLYLGKIDEARLVLDETRSLLFEGQLPHFEQTPLACAYASALGEGPADFALQRLEDLLVRLGPLADVYTTNKDYARPHLEIIDAVVMAVDNLNRTVRAR
jgi:hypothetical protein